jgi:protein involved in polysaccharide export with SLBB domain
MNGRLAGNVRLQDNDVIIISPYDCLVDITGAVKRPMCYEMRRNESVSTLLKYAGSWSNYAYKKQVRILRVNGEQKQVFNVDEFDMSSFKVMDGDAVSVDSILDRYENMVEVKGAVFRPGLYQLGAQITTVRSLVEQAQGLTEDAYAKHAVIHRLKNDRTKTVIALDLEAIMNGDEADIPLKNEDVLFIPTEASKTKLRTLSIHGEVRFPGTYEYAEHQTIEDFIVQAGGLTDAASIAKIDVSRRILDPTATTPSMVLAKTYTFKLENGLIINKNDDFFLEPYDEVYVRKSPGFEVQRHVTIDGEANFPGDYTITYKNMRLTELVKMAGGLTKNAYVRGARILRVMNDEEKIRRNAIYLISQHNLSKKDSVKLSGLQMDDAYYVGIDLEKALKDSLCAENITLREGDRLFIPEYNPTVRISGDVMYPNSVAFEPGKPLSYYIKQAGGYGHRARQKRTFVVYQNGKVGDKNSTIEAGSEIVVPSKPEYKGLSVGNILGIVTAVLSFATIMISVFK